MKSQETPINARPKRRPQLPASARDAARGFEEKVIWPSEDAVRAAGGGVRRGADGVLWTLQNRLLWPLQDRARELDGPRRALVTAAVVLVAAAAGVAGLLWASSGGSGGVAAPQVADTQVTQIPTPTPAPQKSEPAPTLHGAAPVFNPPPEGDAKISSAKGVEESAGGGEPAPEAAASAAASTSAATGKISSSPSTSSAASASSVQTTPASGPPAGPQAIAVAHEFARAFVAYEIGGTEAKVRRAFHATASRELAHALLSRPPKQPATVKVPKARVVNIVAAPSHGTVYPVSVSLLRVGVTSELRLEMEKVDHHWQVTNSLG